ncbi:MAG: radical SAM protein [Desulfobacterales bacterium]|nr:radical SAM protein [Desulfobacterales bacterium]MDD4073247.1 radical SAM protein [Desulfobacterales bacterium]MDD4391376.1 radical SAM protein [Desulfobacterales bacterium]
MGKTYRNVLLLYTDRYYVVKQVYPFGLDLIANYLRQSGYQAVIEYPFLTQTDIEKNLSDILDKTNPDVIGLGLRNLDTTMACEQYGDVTCPDFSAFFFLPDVRRIVEIIKRQRPEIPLIAGGGGFSISPVPILQYLDIDYGVVGEGEEPFLRFLEAVPDRQKLSSVPNLVYRDKAAYRINPRKAYAFRGNDPILSRDSKFNYAFETAGMPVQVKRGCNQNCSYCVEPLIEGRTFSFREPDHVISELKAISKIHESVRSIFFVDTEFNIPDLRYPLQLIKHIMESGLNRYFRFSSQFLPRPFDADFAKLLADAGFSVILTCDSFSDTVLEMNNKSYRNNDITATIELCETHGIDCTVNLIFGLPGETFETVDLTLEAMLTYGENRLRRYEYTVGGRIYNGTPLCRLVEAGNADGQTYGRKTHGYLEPCFYCSPSSPLALKSYIDKALPSPMAFGNRIDTRMHQHLSVAYLADQGLWSQAVKKFLACDIPAQTTIYDYLFKKLTENNRLKSAQTISEQLLKNIFQNAPQGQYDDQVRVIQHYLSLLNLYSE